MKKIALIFAFCFAFCFAGLFVSRVYASDSRAVKVTTLNPDKDEKRDFYLVYGEVVEVTGEVNGDVYAFGGNVLINAKVNGDIIAAGGTVNFSGETSDDVRIAGGQVVISGTVGKNLTVTAGDFQLAKGAGVQGGLVAAAGNIYLDAPVEGEVKLAVGSVNLDGYIGSNVEIWSDSVTLSSDSRIDGDLVYHSDSDIGLSRDASVSGTISRGALPKVNIDEDKLNSLKNSFGKFRLFSKIVSFISALVIGFILIKLFPSCIESTSDLIGKNPGKIILAGFITLVLTPIVLILISLTVIGIPISLIGIFAYMTFIYLSKIFFSLWLGKTIAKKFTKNSYAHLSVGLLVFYLLKLIIFVNFIVSLSSIVTGLGAAVLGSKIVYEKLSKAKID